MTTRSIFLDPGDVERLTGFKRKAEQCQQLAHMGVPFQVNRLGTPLVLLSALEASMGVSQQREGDEALRELERYERAANG